MQSTSFSVNNNGKKAFVRTTSEKNKNVNPPAEDLRIEFKQDLSVDPNYNIV